LVVESSADKNINSQLVDTVPSAYPATNVVNANFTANRTITIPMRTGIQVDTNGPASALMTFSECYDVNGNQFIPPASAYSGPSNSSAIAIRPNDTLVTRVNCSAQAPAGSTLLLTVITGQGTTTVTTVVATLTVSNSGYIDYEFTYKFVNADDRLIGATLTSGSASGINLQTIYVEYFSAATVAYAPTTVICPYSIYIGQAIQFATSSNDLYSQERTIASSLLWTDFSNMLTMQGAVATAQIDSGTFPSESYVLGVNSAGAFQKALVNPEKVGAYSAPFKLKTIDASKFYNLDNAWNGTSPYTALYCKIPGTTIQTMRVEVCDIFEFKSTANQLTMTGSERENKFVVSKISDFMSKHPVLTQNGSHWDWITNAIDTVVGGVKKVLPYASAIANVSGNESAIRATNMISNMIQ